MCIIRLSRNKKIKSFVLINNITQWNRLFETILDFEISLISHKTDVDLVFWIDLFVTCLFMTYSFVTDSSMTHSFMTHSYVTHSFMIHSLSIRLILILFSELTCRPSRRLKDLKYLLAMNIWYFTLKLCFCKIVFL